MSLQTWQETLSSQIAAGTLLNTFTTAKSVINPQALTPIPAGYFSIGKTLRIKIQGAISNIVTTPGTITFQLMLGPSGSIVVFTSGAVQLNATAHTTLPFDLEIILVCRSVGSGTAATLMGIGRLNGIMFTLTAGQVDGVNSSATMVVPVTAPAAGGGFDSTVANILDFWAGFSISNAGNGIQIHNYVVESLN
jgi:hypothetical protein